MQNNLNAKFDKIAYILAEKFCFTDPLLDIPPSTCSVTEKIGIDERKKIKKDKISERAKTRHTRDESEIGLTQRVTNACAGLLWTTKINKILANFHESSFFAKMTTITTHMNIELHQKNYLKIILACALLIEKAFLLFVMQNNELLCSNICLKSVFSSTARFCQLKY